MNIQQIHDLVEQSRAEGNDPLTTAYLIIAELQQETAELRAVVDASRRLPRSAATMDMSGNRPHLVRCTGCGVHIDKRARRHAADCPVVLYDVTLAKLTPNAEEAEDVR